MTDNAFNSALDDIVTGETPRSRDNDLVKFAMELHASEGGSGMSAAARAGIRDHIFSAPIASTGVIRPVPTRDHRRAPVLWQLLIAAAAVVVMLIGGFLLSSGILPGDNNHDSRFLASAVPTVDASATVSQEEDASDAGPAASPATVTEHLPVATPSSADSSWLRPISEQECSATVNPTFWDDMATHDGPTTFPAREYGPYTEPTRTEQESIVTRFRDQQACGYAIEGEQNVSQHARYDRYITFSGFTPDTPRYYADFISRSQDLSSEYARRGLTANDLTLYVTTDDIGTPVPYETQYSVALPQHVMQTADGRLVVLTTNIVYDHSGLVTSTTTPSAITFAYVLSEENGEWVYDETLAVCLGDCDNYWNVVSPQWAHDRSWYMPITPEECDATVDITNPPAGLTRDDALAINTRAQRACNPAAFQPHTQSADFNQDDRSTDPALAAEIRAAYAATGGTPADLRPSIAAAALSGIDLQHGEQIAYDPAHIITLGDDRVAVIGTTLNVVTTGTLPNYSNPRLNTPVVVWQHVNGEWQPGEEMLVCFGECDTGTESSPVATPVSQSVDRRTWLAQSAARKSDQSRGHPRRGVPHA